MPLVEQELLTLPEHLSSPPGFSGDSCYSIFSFMCMFWRSLFILLYVFFCPLRCLFFFDVWILIAPLVSSNSSFYYSFNSFFKKWNTCILNMRQWFQISSRTNELTSWGREKEQLKNIHNLLPIITRQTDRFMNTYNVMLN